MKQVIKEVECLHVRDDKLMKVLERSDCENIEAAFTFAEKCLLLYGYSDARTEFNQPLESKVPWSEMLIRINLIICSTEHEVSLDPSSESKVNAVCDVTDVIEIFDGRKIILPFITNQNQNGRQHVPEKNQSGKKSVAT